MVCLRSGLVAGQQEEWDVEELDIQASANVLRVTNEALSHMSRLVSLKMELAKPPDPVVAFAASNLNIDRSGRSLQSVIMIKIGMA